MTESKDALDIWGDIFPLSFPYLVASAGVAGVVLAATAKIGWQVPLFVLPVMFGVFHSYRRYVGTSRESAPSPAIALARAAAVAGD